MKYRPSSENNSGWGKFQTCYGLPVRKKPLWFFTSLKYKLPQTNTNKRRHLLYKLSAGCVWLKQSHDEESSWTANSYSSVHDVACSCGTRQTVHRRDRIGHCPEVIQFSSSCTLKVSFNTVLPTTPRTHRWNFSVKFPNQFCYTHFLCQPCPVLLFRLKCCNSIRQIIDLYVRSFYLPLAKYRLSQKCVTKWWNYFVYLCFI